MSQYELFLLGGSSMIVLAVLLFFTAATQDQPIQKSLAIFLLGGVLLYFADINSSHGLVPSDIPGVFIKFVQTMFE